MRFPGASYEGIVGISVQVPAAPDTGALSLLSRFQKDASFGLLFLSSYNVSLN